MIYSDEDTRNAFHKASTLLQVICSVLEFEAAKFHAEVHLMEFDDNLAYLQIRPLSTMQLVDLCNGINQRFKLKDGTGVTTIFSTKLGFVNVKNIIPIELQEPT